MVARDRYDVKFECKNCGAIGVLHISEEDRPLIRKLSRRIDGVEGDFEAEMQGSVQIRITCGSCHQHFII